MLVTLEGYDMPTSRKLLPDTLLGSTAAADEPPCAGNELTMAKAAASEAKAAIDNAVVAIDAATLGAFSFDALAAGCKSKHGVIIRSRILFLPTRQRIRHMASKAQGSLRRQIL